MQTVSNIFFIISLSFLALCSTPFELLAQNNPNSQREDISPALVERLDLRREAKQASRVPVQIGDHCIVCGVPLNGDSGIVLMLRGRRVPIASAVMEEFLAEPDKYFEKLQPKGALFTESEKQKYSRAWLVLGVLAIILLISAGVAAAQALARGQNAKKWFFFGLFGNVFASSIVRSKHKIIDDLPQGMAKIPATSDPLACAGCGTANHPTARSCSGCGGELSPKFESEAQKFRTLNLSQR